MEPEIFQQGLLSWFDQHGRKNLPWQHPRSAYRVWVSEIMLQQTQVATVIPYFERFMDRFPRVEDLAAADQDHVLQLWAGLGYYARARNLHKAAQTIVAIGGFPDQLDELCDLPGIGRSTAGAILSMAFNRPHAILDGNVKRVLSRCFAVHGWPGATSVSNELWGISEKLTPQLRVVDYTQAIMDLGATVCVRKRPHCALCPFQDHCLAFKQNLTAILPESKPKKTTPAKTGAMLFLRDVQGRFLLEKRPPVGIWGGLWCVPQLASAEPEAIQVVLDEYAIQVGTTQHLAQQRHTFSHYHYDFVPVVANVETQSLRETQEKDWIWYHPSQKTAVGLPTPVQNLITLLIQQEVTDGQNSPVR